MVISIPSRCERCIGQLCLHSRLPDLRGDRHGQLLVPFGINLSHVRARVTEKYLHGFQTVLLPNPRRETVPKLIRVPVVGLPPRGQFESLFLGQPSFPFCSILKSMFTYGYYED